MPIFKMPTFKTMLILFETTAKLLQLCLTLCDPIDGSPPGSPVPGILQARTLEWVAISFSNAWKWKGKVKSLSHVRLFTTPWTAAYRAPPSMGFSRQEYWNGVPLPWPHFAASWSFGYMTPTRVKRRSHMGKLFSVKWYVGLPGTLSWKKIIIRVEIFYL